MADKYVRKVKKQKLQAGFSGSVKGCYNSFIAGFLTGVKQKIEKQSQALMIIVPPDVEKGYEDKNINATLNPTLKVSFIDEIAMNEGVSAGRNTMDARALDQRL